MSLLVLVLVLVLDLLIARPSVFSTFFSPSKQLLSSLRQLSYSLNE